MPTPTTSRRTVPRTCVQCGANRVRPTTIDREVDVKHDGKVHHVVVRGMPVERCGECGETTLGTDADERIDAALREHLGLLSPECIRASRVALGMTQAQLAGQVGCASETLSRWENGALVQSRGMDLILRAYFALPSLRAFCAALKQDRTLGASVVVDDTRGSTPDAA